MLSEFPAEVLVFILAFLQRMDLDPLQLVCSRFYRFIRSFESDRAWLQLPRHTAILSMRAANFKPRIELLELNVYSYVNWSEVAHYLQKARLSVVSVRGLNGPFELSDKEWTQYIRKVRKLRSLWNNAVINFEQVPLSAAMARVFMQQFLNASEIRFPHPMPWFCMPDDFSNPRFDIILPKITQLFVSQVLVPSADVDGWLRIPRPQGMRRFVVRLPPISLHVSIYKI